jgi:hypothetical protein
MGKTPKVAGLFEKRQKIEKEIEKLQKSCQHPSNTKRPATFGVFPIKYKN